MTENTEGLFDWFEGGGETKPSKPPVAPTYSLSTVSVHKSVPVSGGTIKVSIPSGIKNPVVLAFAEEDKPVSVSFPKIPSKPLNLVNPVKLKKIDLKLDKSKYHVNGVKLKNLGMKKKASTSTLKNMSKASISKLNVNTIVSKLHLDGSTGLIAKTNNMLKKGMGLPSIPTPSMKMLPKFPTISGLGHPKLWYVVFVPRYHWVDRCSGHMKGTKPEINKDCPYNGWIIPYYETSDLKGKSYSKKKSTIESRIKKIFPTKSEWGKWLAYQKQGDALSEIKSGYSNAAYENMLHAMGTWKAGGITLDCVLKPPLGKLMSAVMSPAIRSIVRLDGKIDGTIKSAINALNKIVIGNSTNKYNGIKVPRLYSPYWRAKGRTYISALESAINTYNHNKTSKNAKTVRDYLVKVIQHPPVLKDAIVPYTGGINASIDAIRLNINSIISMSNVISKAIPIATVGSIKGSVDSLAKPAYSYINGLGRGIKSMVDTWIGQYNSYITGFNKQLGKMRKDTINSIKDTIAVLNQQIDKFNESISSLESNINKTVASTNSSLSYIANKLSESVNTFNTSILSTENNLNTNIIPSLNDTIKTVNSAIKTINNSKSGGITVKSTYPLTPKVSDGYFTVTMGKGTLHYTIIGMSLKKVKT